MTYHIDPTSNRFKVMEDLLHRGQIGLADALELLDRPLPTYQPYQPPLDISSTGTFTVVNAPSTSTLA